MNRITKSITFSVVVLAINLKWQITGIDITTLVPRTVPESASILSKESFK